MIGERGARARAPEALATGQILAGRYKIGRLLRDGGMGAVYEGEHTDTGRRVALKLVHLDAPALSDVEARFEREARIASNVQSKHVVQVFDAGRDPVLGPFMAMELLKGEDLEDHLLRKGKLSPKTACAIAFQAARGLEKAHAANVAHRDLKPANLFLVDSDEEEFLVKVLDFGIARLVEEDPANPKLTREGNALGTPLYMSPEQARGFLDVDGRTDVYSLGAVLYQMIVGRPHVPDLPNFNQIMIHIATVTAPRVSSAIPDIDPRIDRLVADMLVGDRRDRLRSMRAVRERIAAILDVGARARSLPDGSGSFVAREGSASFAHLGEGSSSAIRAAAALPAGDEDEGVHFFDRASVSSAPAATASNAVEEAGPESEKEPVALFDRSSLRLPAVPDRTSSGAHVVDATPRPAPIVVRREPRPRDAAPTPAARRHQGGTRRWMAAAALTAVFLILGSVRLVTSRGHEDPPSTSAAASQPGDVTPAALSPAPAPSATPAGHDGGATIAAPPAPAP